LPGTTEHDDLTLLIFLHVYNNRQLYQVLRQNQTLGFVIQHQMNPLVDVFRQRLSSDQHMPSSTQMRSYQLAGALYAQILWWLEHDLIQSPQAMAQAFSDFTGSTSNPPRN